MIMNIFGWLEKLKIKVNIEKELSELKNKLNPYISTYGKVVINYGSIKTTRQLDANTHLLIYDSNYDKEVGRIYVQIVWEYCNNRGVDLVKYLDSYVDSYMVGRQTYHHYLHWKPSK